MYDWVSNVLSVPADSNDIIVSVAGLSLIAVLIAVLFCITRLFK